MKKGGFSKKIFVIIISVMVMCTNAMADNSIKDIISNNILENIEGNGINITKEALLQHMLTTISHCTSIYNNKVFINVYCFPNVYIDDKMFIYYEEPLHFGNMEQMSDIIKNDINNNWLKENEYIMQIGTHGEIYAKRIKKESEG